MESTGEIVNYFTKHDRRNYYNSSYFHALLFELGESPDYKYMLRQLMLCADKVYTGRASAQAQEGGLLRVQAKDDPVSLQFDFKHLWTTVILGDYSEGKLIQVTIVSNRSSCTTLRTRWR
jgi:hypothetical protein